MESIEWRELMEEPIGGHAAGRAASTNPNADGRWEALDVPSWQAHDLMREGGWGLIETGRGSGRIGSTYGDGDAGMTAHRGILDPGGRGGDASDSQDVGEYVDELALLAAVEAELGFTSDDVHSVYRQGRLSSAQRELRARIDARLLALSRSGGVMLALARMFGWAIEPADAGGGERCKTMERALERARAAEAVAA